MLCYLLWFVGLHVPLVFLWVARADGLRGYCLWVLTTLVLVGCCDA